MKVRNGLLYSIALVIFGVAPSCRPPVDEIPEPTGIMINLAFGRHPEIAPAIAKLKGTRFTEVFDEERFVSATTIAGDDLDDVSMSALRELRDGELTFFCGFQQGGITYSVAVKEGRIAEIEKRAEGRAEKSILDVAPPSATGPNPDETKPNKAQQAKPR